MGRLCYPTPAPPQSCPGRPPSCHGARRVWRGFCKSRYKVYRSRACRGTSFIGARKLSRYRKFVRGTCAVSRYNFDRSQETVTVQDLYCGHVRVSGCKFQQDLSWEQGAAKTMTNNLPILSVLQVVEIQNCQVNQAVRLSYLINHDRYFMGKSEISELVSLSFF